MNKFIAQMGNDAVIRVSFFETEGRIDVQDGAPYDLSKAQDITIELVNQFRKRTKMAYKIEAPNVLVIELPVEQQKLGNYFLEVLFQVPNPDLADGLQAYRLRLDGVSIVEAGAMSGQVGATFGVVDPNTPTRAALLAQIETLTTERDNAKEAQAQAEEGKTQAEQERDQARQDKTAAEEGKAQAEQERDTAKEAQATAEQDKTQAEAERDQARQDKDAADEAKAQAEQERDQAKEAQATAERDKTQAETERDQAVRDKTAADEAKAQAEQERDTAKEAQATAERDKTQAEADRDQARQDKAAADEAKAQAEQDRDQALQDKATAETQRDQARARVAELEANANNGVGGDDSNAGKTTLEVEDEEFSDADRMSHLLRLANDSRGSFNAGDIHLKQVAVINGDGKEMQYPMATHNDWLSCASSIRADRLAHLYGSSLTLKGEINMPKLRSIKTNNGLNLSSVTSINMPSLEAIYGDVRGVNVETIDLPSLKSCGTLDVNSSVIKIPNIVACKVKAPNATYIDLSNVSRRNINSADISLDLSATTSPGVLTIKVSPYVYNWIFTDVEGDVYPSLYIFKAFGIPPIKSGNTREEDEYQLNVTDGNNTKTYRHIGSLDDDFFIPPFEGDM